MDNIIIKKRSFLIYRDYIEQIPDSIENVILSNISGLGETAINFLNVASCIGNEFNLNWVIKVLKDNFDEEEIISELKQRNIISLKAVYTSDRILNKVFVFNHDTVRMLFIAAF